MSFLGSILKSRTNTYKSGKDSFGTFTIVEEFRSNGTKMTRSVLSGTAPYYNTRTVTEYDVDGVTVISTTIYDLTYDQLDLISEVKRAS